MPHGLRICHRTEFFFCPFQDYHHFFNCNGSDKIQPVTVWTGADVVTEAAGHNGDNKDVEHVSQTCFQD